MPSLVNEIEPLKQSALADLKSAPDLAALERAKGNWIGTHGKFTALMKQLGSLPKEERPAPGDGLQLIRYRPLFSGPAVERIPELQFQRPEPEVELSRLDAEARGIAAGETVSVSHNGTSLALHARISRDVRQGVARIAAEHAGDLGGSVEVAKQ